MPIVGWIIIGVVLVVAAWVVLTFNKLVALRNETESSFSGIDVQLKRRADLVPNLVEVVKAYASHESATLEAVTAARQATVTAGTPLEMAVADGLMQGAMTGIMGLAESYPDLKASSGFVQLQGQISETEDRLASARRMFNAVVQRYNTYQQSLPQSLLASSFGHHTRDFYRVEDDREREPVAVSFGSGSPA